MQRRDFIRDSCTACLSATMLSFLAAGCAPTLYAVGKITNDGLVLGKDEFKIRQQGGTSYSSFIIVRNEAFLFPICVYRFSETDYSAIWMKCAHQGAELNASGDKLQCPAHGSEYNNRGEVTNGPAETNLKTFPVVVRAHEIFIDMRKQS